MALKTKVKSYLAFKTKVRKIHGGKSMSKTHREERASYLRKRRQETGRRGLSLFKWK